jgi:peptidoglycan/xylan/chitin deacetylase (PgdA/CDA1 family)
VRSILLIFCFFILLLLYCGSEDDVTSGPEESDTTRTDTKGSEYPEPDKLCALTFDDGPDATKTNLVLDELENHDVVATFFVVGQRINNNTKPVLERVVSMGCEIGNHSYGYSSMDRMDSAQISESVENTNYAIEEYAGMTPKFFRPPNLAVSNTMYEVIDLPFAEGVLGFDWAGGGGDTPEKVANYVLSGMRDGAIILLHDVQPDPHPTPEALDILIPALKDLGYEFVTLRDLFDRKDVNPDVEYKMWKYVE